MPTCPFCKKRELTGSELQEHITLKHPEEATEIGNSRYKQTRKFKKSEKKQPIVLDGNNIAYSSGKMAKIINIKKARAMLQKEGYLPIIFVSAALRHDIDEPNELNRLINLRWIIETETGEDDDIMLIEEAQRKQCHIVSNDNFKKYLKDYATSDWELKSSILKFEFKDGKFNIL